MTKRAFEEHSVDSREAIGERVHEQRAWRTRSARLATLVRASLAPGWLQRSLQGVRVILCGVWYLCLACGCGVCFKASTRTSIFRDRGEECNTIIRLRQ